MNTSGFLTTFSLWMRRYRFFFRRSSTCVTQLALAGSGTDAVGLFPIQPLKNSECFLRSLMISVPLISLR